MYCPCCEKDRPLFHYECCDRCRKQKRDQKFSYFRISIGNSRQLVRVPRPIPKTCSICQKDKPVTPDGELRDNIFYLRGFLCRHCATLKATLNPALIDRFNEYLHNSTRNEVCQPLKRLRYNTSKQRFLEKAYMVHGDYDYSKALYVNYNTPIIITCPAHGDFKTTPKSHIKGRGCPLCSKGEKEISRLLKYYSIPYRRTPEGFQIGPQLLVYGRKKGDICIKQYHKIAPKIEQIVRLYRAGLL